MEKMSTLMRFCYKQCKLSWWLVGIMTFLLKRLSFILRTFHWVKTMMQWVNSKLYKELMRSQKDSGKWNWTWQFVKLLTTAKMWYSRSSNINSKNMKYRKFTQLGNWKESVIRYWLRSRHWSKKYTVKIWIIYHFSFTFHNCWRMRVRLSWRVSC